MKIYVVLIEDRRVDIEVELFNNKEAAIKWAQEQARKFTFFPEDFREAFFPEGSLGNFLYSADCEDDSVRVSVHNLKEAENDQENKRKS